MKYRHVIIILVIVLVAPLVGAWIEILTVLSAIVAVVVAPLVGAWIEILLKEIYGEGY